MRQLAHEVKISVRNVEKGIYDYLHMGKVSARWIPGCSHLDILITQDETWVHHYDLETKAHSKQWKHFDSPPPKKALVPPSAGKVMKTVFWDQCGEVMMDILAKGTKINEAYYASLLTK